MTVTIASLTLGPLGNNVYILGDEESGAAVVIDPSFEPRRQADEIRRRGWTLRQIWLTHGHFDHTEGAAALRELFSPAPLVGMHPDAQDWVRTYGKRFSFGFRSAPLPPVDVPFYQGQRLKLNPDGGKLMVESGAQPGLGHFYWAEAGAAIVVNDIPREHWQDGFAGRKSPAAYLGNPDANFHAAGGDQAAPRPRAGNQRGV